MKKLLVIGFQKYDERMYPHLHDVLKCLEKNFKLTYYSNDDRGFALRFVPTRILPITHHLLSYMQSEIVRGHQISIIARNKFDIVIAIDHTALNLAFQYFSNKSKLVFWSLDYLAPELAANQRFFVRNLLQSNWRNIQKYSLVIVQDRNRGKILDQLLGCSLIPHYYLPVSLSDNSFSKKIASRKTKKTQTAKTVLMQITADINRYSDILLRAYQSFDKNILLSLQGTVSVRLTKQLGKLKKKPLIFPICGTIAEMQQNIAKADIGLLAYKARDSNETYLSTASGQLVEFLRLGIPIIVYKHHELGKYVESQQIGIYINNFSEIGKASKIIIKHYAQFSSQARLIYKRNFDIHKFANSLTENLYRL